MKLLEKLRQHLGVQTPVDPVTNDYIVIPPTDVLDAASLLIQGGRVALENTVAPACVRVRHVKPPTGTETSDTEADEADEEALRILSVRSTKVTETPTSLLNQMPATKEIWCIHRKKNDGNTSVP